MNELQIFENEEFGEIRTITINDEPWFVASDICKALDIQNVTQAVHRLDEDERSMLNIGRQGEAHVVNEYGLYNLILASRKLSAKKFKRWITHEILPSIRKTGHYAMPSYAPKATSVGEVVNLIRVTKETMKEQGATPTEIAKVIKQLCEQFGVELPSCFITPKQTTMTDVYEMVEFIYSKPRGKGKPLPTYDDFIMHQMTCKRIGGETNGR